MFSSLSDKLQGIFHKLRGKGKLSEADVEACLREVKLALLEADVNFKVVKRFISRIKERSIGQEVMKSLTPAQQVIKIVNEELIELMGGSTSRITLAPNPPTVVVVIGLHGSGKTTIVAKLGRNFSKQGHNPMLVAADIYRPAGIKQLQVLGESLNIPVFTMGDKQSPPNIVNASKRAALKQGCDMVLVDTAGRLHIDDEMMEELRQIKKVAKPNEVLLIVDAMTGQDAVNIASSFNEQLGIDGIILTKLDGDTRGGAALSAKEVTGKPIKFIGTGEKLDALEPFHPDRMASRILGMGDMLSLIEKAEQTIDRERAEELERKIRKAEFTLEDFLEQMHQVRNMGPLDQLLGMIPGFGKIKNLDVEVDEKQLDKIEAIINSMTIEERRNPSIIGGSRRRRIARGSGTNPSDVNQLLSQFFKAKKMLKQLTKGKFPIGIG